MNTTKKPTTRSTARKPITNPEPALLEFFKDEIKDIYWAENHLVKTLPKMKKAATSPELIDAIAEHLEVTK